MASASNAENNELTKQLANEIMTRLNDELRAGDFDTLTNVMTALQIVVAKALLMTGVPPAVFMELVTRTMMRQGSVPS